MAESNIYKKMLKATEKIQSVAKNLEIEISKGKSYKAVGETDVLKAVKPIEIELGIFSYPVSRKIIETATLENETQYGTTKKLFMRIETIYRFVNVDNPSEFVEITSYGDGIDSGDKATGKAMTYSDKYALLKAYKIATGDDPDQEPSQELKTFSNNDKATPKQVEVLRKNYQGENLTKLLQANNITKLEDMPKQKATNLISKLTEIQQQKKENNNAN